VTDPITSDILVTITCAGVVAMYSAKRYNTPETNRVSTTQVRFLFTCAGYVVASLALFLLLCEKPYPCASGSTKCCRRGAQFVLEQITNITRSWWLR